MENSLSRLLPAEQSFTWDHQTKVTHISSVLHILEEFHTKDHTYLWKPQVRKLTKRNTLSWKVEELFNCNTPEEAARLILINHKLEPPQ